MANPLFGGMANYGPGPSMGGTLPAVTPTPGYIANPGNRLGMGYQVTPGVVMQPGIPATPMNQMLNSMQMNTPQSNLYWVKSPDAIPSYAIGRGWQQWFGDENEPKLYIREMDMNGVMLPLRTVWISETPPAQIQQAAAPATVPVQAPAQPQPVVQQSQQTFAQTQPVLQNQNAQIQAEPMAPVAQTAQPGPTREEFDALLKQTAATNTQVAELTQAFSPLVDKLSEFLK